METNIISVKYESQYEPGTFDFKSYKYFTNLELKVGDIVIAPTVNGEKIARVSEINIPEYKVETIKHLMRWITQKIDKIAYLEKRVILKDVA